MKNKIIGLFSVVILITSILMTPKIEAFNMRDIVIECGTNYLEDCVTVIEVEKTTIYRGGIKDIRVE